MPFPGGLLVVAEVGGVGHGGGVCNGQFAVSSQTQQAVCSAVSRAGKFTLAAGINCRTCKLPIANCELYQRRYSSSRPAAISSRSKSPGERFHTFRFLLHRL